MLVLYTTLTVRASGGENKTMFYCCNAQRALCTYSISWTGPDCSGKLWPVEHLLICICTHVDKNHHQVYCPDCFICWGMGVKWDTINSREPKTTLSINLVIVTEHSSGGSGGSLSSGESEVKEIQSSCRLTFESFNTPVIFLNMFWFIPL